MAEEEVRQKNRELKIKRRDYTGYDDEEFKDGNQGVKQTILAKYDEELEGPKDSVYHHSLLPSTFLCLLYKGFRLGSAIVSTKVKREEEKQSAAVAVNKSLLSIDYTSLLLLDLLILSLMGILQKTLIFLITSRRAISVSRSQRRVGCMHAV